MKKLSALVLFGLLVAACGGEGSTDSNQEIGSVEQPMFGAHILSTGTTYGVVRGSTDFHRCTNSGSEDCLIPALGDKNLVVCVSSDNITSYAGAALQAVDDIANQAASAGWTISYYQANNINCTHDHSFAANDITVEADGNTCSGTCSTSSGIDACVCVTPLVGLPIDENEAGSYHQMAGGTIHIDYQDINLHIASSSRYNIIAHGVAHDLAILLGLGGVAHSTSLQNNASDKGSTANGVDDTISSSEMCELTDYKAAAPGSYAIHYACN